ncbi:MAG: hypothetical protein VX241_04500 [Pseudomonadota bacterium]|nr:hypothetical protein [Pseudomonadota bacterium]
MKFSKIPLGIFLPIIIITISVLGWIGYWYAGSYYIQKKIEQSNNISIEKISVGGFPFYFNVDAKNIVLKSKQYITTDYLNVRSLAWRFDQIRLETHKPVSIDFLNGLSLFFMSKKTTLDFQEQKDANYEIRMFSDKPILKDNIKGYTLALQKINFQITIDSNVKSRIYSEISISKSPVIVDGMLSPDRRGYLKGELNFNFTNPEDIRNMFTIFNVDIAKNSIINLLLINGKITVSFDRGISLIGPVPIGPAPKIK